MMELTQVMAIVVPGVAAIVWAVRIEGRVKAHDDMVASLRDDVRYIRQHVDSFLSRGPHLP